ncbi:hypothetical protein QAD02_011384 [Eretmocerus hayati]|uniref:Uncharacterized protein n=1 Tax=Eretmocerus hayati TaxID=131215 RepID=A0ACC2NXL1_9HYME|nr:hypothetical protein QAD02_011384 [Eretmocerus hayati]
MLFLEVLGVVWGRILNEIKTIREALKNIEKRAEGHVSTTAVLPSPPSLVQHIELVQSSSFNDYNNRYRFRREVVTPPDYNEPVTPPDNNLAFFPFPSPPPDTLQNPNPFNNNDGPVTPPDYNDAPSIFPTLLPKPSTSTETSDRPITSSGSRETVQDTDKNTMSSGISDSNTNSPDSKNQPSDGTLGNLAQKVENTLLNVANLVSSGLNRISDGTLLSGIFNGRREDSSSTTLSQEKDGLHSTGLDTPEYEGTSTLANILSTNMTLEDARKSILDSGPMPDSQNVEVDGKIPDGYSLTNSPQEDNGISTFNRTPTTFQTQEPDGILSSGNTDVTNYIQDNSGGRKTDLNDDIMPQDVRTSTSSDVFPTIATQETNNILNDIVLISSSTQEYYTSIPSPTQGSRFPQEDGKTSVFSDAASTSFAQENIEPVSSRNIDPSYSDQENFVRGTTEYTASVIHSKEDGVTFSISEVSSAIPSQENEESPRIGEEFQRMTIAARTDSPNFTEELERTSYSSTPFLKSPEQEQDKLTIHGVPGSTINTQEIGENDNVNSMPSVETPELKSAETLTPNAAPTVPGLINSEMKISDSSNDSNNTESIGYGGGTFIPNDSPVLEKRPESDKAFVFDEFPTTIPTQRYESSSMASNTNLVENQSGIYTSNDLISVTTNQNSKGAPTVDGTFVNFITPNTDGFGDSSNSSFISQNSFMQETTQRFINQGENGVGTTLASSDFGTSKQETDEILTISDDSNVTSPSVSVKNDISSTLLGNTQSFDPIEQVRETSNLSNQFSENQENNLVPSLNDPSTAIPVQEYDKSYISSNNPVDNSIQKNDDSSISTDQTPTSFAQENAGILNLPTTYYPEKYESRTLAEERKESSSVTTPIDDADTGRKIFYF